MGGIPLPSRGIVGKNLGDQSKTTVRSKRVFPLKVKRGLLFHINCLVHFTVFVLYVFAHKSNSRIKSIKTKYSWALWYSGMASGFKIRWSQIFYPRKNLVWCHQNEAINKKPRSKKQERPGNQTWVPSSNRSMSQKVIFCLLWHVKCKSLIYNPFFYGISKKFLENQCFPVFFSILDQR